MPTRMSQGSELKSLVPFLGMMSDKSGSINRKPGHFDLLENCYADIDEIKKRKGYAKYIDTHADGSTVYGMHYQQSSYGNQFRNVKMITGTNNLRFYNATGSAWITQNQHTYPTTDTSFVEMDGFDEWNGAYNITESVKTGSTATDVKLNSGTGPWATNFLVGTIARFTRSASNVEYKEIIGNYHDGTDDHILFSADDPLNGIPASGIAIKIRQKGNMLYIAGGSEYSVISSQEAIAGISSTVSSSGYKALHGTAYAHNGFTGIATHANRVVGWKGRRLSLSDPGNGHNFGSNTYFDFQSDVRIAKSFSDNILIIYETNRIWALIGVSPISWELRLITDEFGTNYIKTVANYSSVAFTMQVFVSSDGNVKAITSDTFKQISREAKIQSLTENYIRDEFTETFNFICAGVDEDGKYTVFKTDSTFYTLNIAASERIGFKQWIWSKGSTNFYPNIAVKIAGYLRLGNNSNGQMYTWNSGYSDDSTAIAVTIRRRGLNFDRLGDKTKFKRLDITQGSKDSSTTITVKCEANNSGSSSTIDYTLGTHDPSTGDKLRSYKIPNNPSLREGTGQMIDYQITESSSVKIAPIEDIAFRFKASVIK